MRPFELVRPKNPAQALAARQEGSAFKAGGIDLLDLMKERLATPSRLVDLSGLDLRAIEETPEGVRVGALATLADVAAAKPVRALATALAEAAEEAATPQVRNRATVGGNLLQRSRCWFYRSSEYEPCLKRGGKTCPAKEGPNRIHAVFATDAPCVSVHPSNLAPALVALDALALVHGKAGERRVPIAELFVDGTRPERDHALEDGELLLGVVIPRGAKSAYREVGERQSFDWALASAAVAFSTVGGGTIARAHLVLGAVAHRPWVAAEAGAFLQGKRLDKDVAARAGELAVKGAAPLRDNAFKTQLARTLVARALLAASEGPR